jgi:ribosomal protein S12 methylthiotransferase accessory factor
MRTHTLVVDQPQASGGTNDGPTPPELLVTALGTCAGVYAVFFCEKHGISTEGLTVLTDYEKMNNPARIGKMDITIELPAGIPDALLESFWHTVHACLVHNTFTTPPEINMALAAPASA